MRIRVFACAAVALLLAGSLTTVSGQVQNPRTNSNGGFDLDLYETVDNTPTGAKSELGLVVVLPTPVVPGWVVLLENLNPNLGHDPANWSDVVQFGERTVLLRSEVEGRPWDPTLVDLVTHGNTTWMAENWDATPTLYSSFPNRYYIWSDPPISEVPEPGQIASGLVVLLFAGGYAGRRAWLCRKG